MLGLFDDTLNVVVESTYDSWGNILSVTGSKAATVGKANPFRYRGYYYDEESGLYYLQSRYYDPATGRFVNADGVLGANQSISAYNLFIYCGNNPVNHYDPSGLYWVGINSGKIWFTLDSRARWEMEIYEGGIGNCIYKKNTIPDPREIVKSITPQKKRENQPSHTDKVLGTTSTFMSVERTIVTSLGSFANLTSTQSAQLSIWGYATSTPWAIGAHLADSRLTLSQKVKLVEMEITAAIGGVVVSTFAPVSWAGVAMGATYSWFASTAISNQAQIYYDMNYYMTPH